MLVYNRARISWPRHPVRASRPGLAAQAVESPPTFSELIEAAEADVFGVEARPMDNQRGLFATADASKDSVLMRVPLAVCSPDVLAHPLVQTYSSSPVSTIKHPRALCCTFAWSTGGHSAGMPGPRLHSGPQHPRRPLATPEIRPRGARNALGPALCARALGCPQPRG